MYKIAELQNIELYEYIIRCQLTMLYRVIYIHTVDSVLKRYLIRVNDVS